MPLNEIEKNPFKNYHIEHHGAIDMVPWHQYLKMIIGSFPIYALTETILPTIGNAKRYESYLGLPFYYGSVSNKFWKLLITSLSDLKTYLEINQAIGSEQKRMLIEFLEQHNIIITDILEQTNRYELLNGEIKEYSPSDSALMQVRSGLKASSQEMLKFNSDISNWLYKSDNIVSIYFTAQGCKGKNPGGWFFDMIRQEKISYRIVEKYPNALIGYFRFPNGKKKDCTLFFLPTPSSSRSIALTQGKRHPMFVKYLQSVDLGLYALLEKENFKTTGVLKDMVSEHREKFISQWWLEYFVNENHKFDGSVQGEEN